MELIIYIAVAALVLSTLATLSLQLITYLNRNSARAQVRRDLVAVIERLKQETHYARSIDTAASVFSAHPGKLQITMPDYPITPTIFETVESGGVRRLTIQQGTGPQQFLTADTVDVDRLIFYNLMSPFAASRAINVRAVIRLKYRNPDALTDFAYSMTATTSIELMNR